MDKPVKLDVLAIAAHPDDIEITCGGLMIKMARMGRKTGALDLTRGEMGTHGTEADRDAESAEAGRIMELVWRGNLELPDSALEYNHPNKLKLAQVIRDTRPELVILPHEKQRHPDHLACHRLGYDACFLSGLKKVDLEGEPYRPRKIIYASYMRNMDYSFLVDISGVFPQKVKAVAAYKSQFGERDNIKEALVEGAAFVGLERNSDIHNVFHPGVNIYDMMHIRFRQLGQLVGCQYAEAYTMREHVRIDDPMTMPVQSI